MPWKVRLRGFAEKSVGASVPIVRAQHASGAAEGRGQQALGGCRGWSAFFVAVPS